MFSRLLASAVVTSAVLVPFAQPAAAAAPSVQITRIYYDSPGTDTRSNTVINREYVTIKNTNRVNINIGGWVLVDRSNHRYVFRAGQIIGAGKSLTIRTGKGTNTSTTLYQGRGWYVWNNDKDTAYLRKSNGALADYCSYNSTRTSYKNC
ncbi:hypothetical protein Ppa06_68900 [Planomonospora parontospora subsp. parontospora]|uniref:LTD domain-containing protein n=2 Tax=Planomonospora parontospora TaxID=58119 RepID=A0AA37BNW1_9ACTN|nr:lamin tail domain-containing protein [Planomonospora parontospora]GGL00536.1 hypothetical protein GCM10010126_69920 [Planomonospora parontospora]GII13092.1 hypothetical protein Ppa06_68900 [Planomonospora parontospora subsp. parontospora]